MSNKDKRVIVIRTFDYFSSRKRARIRREVLMTKKQFDRYVNKDISEIDYSSWEDQVIDEYLKD